MATADGNDKSDNSIQPRIFRSPSVLFTTELKGQFAGSRILSPQEYEGDDDYKSLLNFFSVPLKFERFTVGGLILCLDIFLYTLVFVPLRSVLALLMIIWGPILHLCGEQFCMWRRHDFIAALYDLLTFGLIISSTWVLYRIHVVEFEETYLNMNSLVALAAWTGMMETFDEMLTPLGRSARKAFKNTFWQLAESGQNYKLPHSSSGFNLLKLLKFGLVFCISTVIMVAHAMTYFFHLICMKRAIEKKSLLPILVINNFGELKSTVNKKIAVTDLYELTIFEVVERFKIGVFLVCVALLFIFSGPDSNTVTGSSAVSGTGTPEGIFKSSDNNNLLLTIWESICFTAIEFIPVIVSEIMTDNAKHTFIIRHNNTPATVYDDFTEKLQEEINRAATAGSDRDSKLNKTMHLADKPMACVIFACILHVLERTPAIATTTADATAAATVAGTATAAVNGNIDAAAIAAAGNPMDLIFTVKSILTSWISSSSAVLSDQPTISLCAIFAILAVLKLMTGTGLTLWATLGAHNRKLKTA